MTVLPRRIKDTLAPASQVRQTSTFAVHRREGAGYINISEQKSVEPICTLRVPWPPVSTCQHVIVNRYLKNPSPRFSHSIHVKFGRIKSSVLCPAAVAFHVPCTNTYTNVFSLSLSWAAHQRAHPPRGWGYEPSLTRVWTVPPRVLEHGWA